MHKEAFKTKGQFYASTIKTESSLEGFSGEVMRKIKNSGMK